MATRQEKLEKKVNDARKQAVDVIIDMMETKGLQWVCEWESGAFMPKNGATSRPYHGGNRMHLMAMAYHKGYEDRRWFTFNQAKKMGYFPRKGESACLVEYWKPMAFKKEVENNDGTTSEEIRQFIKLCGCFWVFNAEQLTDENGEPMPTEEIEEKHLDENLVKVANKLKKTSRCTVQERKDIVQAAYSPVFDVVKMPKRENFTGMEAFITTLTHEMTHSTMAVMGRKQTGFFGDSDYAYEELVAELGSVFTCLELGVHRTGELEGDENFENHAAYLQSWLKALKHDPDALFKASADADKAADYLMARYNGEDTEERRAA